MYTPIVKSYFIHEKHSNTFEDRHWFGSTESIKQKLKIDVSTEKFFPLIMAGIAFHMSGWTSS